MEKEKKQQQELYIQRKKQEIRNLTNNVLEVSPERFFELKKHVSADDDCEGVYIFLNHTKQKHYVGQAKHMFQRVNNHLSGRGNGDVYADYKYGDDFTIKMVELKNSGFSTLNELERNMIMAYDAYTNGYNRTRGNKG